MLAIFCFWTVSHPKRASQVVLVVKNLLANAGDMKDSGSILRSGRSPGGGHSNPTGILAWRSPWTEEWWATVHSVAESQTRLKQLSSSSEPS